MGVGAQDCVEIRVSSNDNVPSNIAAPNEAYLGRKAMSNYLERARERVLMLLEGDMCFREGGSSALYLHLVP